jgi:hypothetical protein
MGGKSGVSVQGKKYIYDVSVQMAEEFMGNQK